MTDADWKENWKKIGDIFDERRAHKPKFKGKNCLIVAHGDLDGIVSAIMMKYIIKYDRVETKYTRAHYVKLHNPNATKEEDRGIITDPYDLIVVVDIAVNNRDPQATINFVESVKNKLLWIDHHESAIDIPHCIIDRRDSCVELIQELFPDVKYPKKVNELIKFAHETDLGRGDNIFDHSLKINLRSDEARKEIDDYGTSIIGGEGEATAINKIMIKSARHQTLINNSHEVIDTLRTIHGNVAIVDMRDYRDKTINSTYFFRKCYEDTPVVILKYLSTKKEDGGEEYLKIARSNNVNLNLVRLFHLRSGAPFRITIPNARPLTPQEEKDSSLIKGREVKKTVYDTKTKRKRTINTKKVTYKDEELVKIIENGLKKIGYSK